jgi:hypothetical protein
LHRVSINLKYILVEWAATLDELFADALVGQASFLATVSQNRGLNPWQFRGFQGLNAITLVA